MILMLEKISVKTTTVIFLLCAVALALCACVNPVDIDKFLNDKVYVQPIIQKTHIKVYVDDKTGDGLEGFKGGIRGLKNNKYYMVVKETDDKGDIVVPTVPYPKYVTDYIKPGELRADLGLITRIKKGSINDLENFHTYTVRSAEPIKSSKGDDLSIPYTVDGATTPKKVTNGVLTVNSGVADTGTLDLSTVIKGDYYEVMAVKVDFGVDDEDYDPKDSPWNWDYKSTDPDNTDNYFPDLNWASFQLVSKAKAAKVDYIFVKKSTNIDNIEFKVLRVEIQSYVPTEITFEIELTFTDQAKASASIDTIKRGTFDGDKSAKLSLTAPVGGGSWDPGSIKWSVSGLSDSVTASHVSGGVLTITNDGDFLPILAADSINVTVYAALKGVPYSDIVTITVIN